VGYERVMQADVKALLELFSDRVPDPESNRRVRELVADRSRWSEARDLFHEVRSLNFAAIRSGDRLREQQYAFEEVCLQSLYNEVAAHCGFDLCTPHWIIKNALHLGRGLGMDATRIAGIVAP
jgi:hypothetical protein